MAVMQRSQDGLKPSGTQKDITKSIKLSKHGKGYQEGGGISVKKLATTTSMNK